MSQIAEAQCLDLDSLIPFFRSRALSLPNPNTRARYLSVVNSFAAATSGSPYSSLAADTEPAAPILTAPRADTSQLRCALSSYLLSLWLSGTALKTVILNLDILSSLYNRAVKAGIASSTDLFRTLKAWLKSLGDANWEGAISEEIFERALRLTKHAAYCVSDDAIAVDMVLLSLINGCMPLSDIARLKRSDIERLDSDSQAICRRQLGNSRRSYVFPLAQSDSTSRQIAIRQQQLIRALFRRTRLPLSDNVFDTIRSLWAYAALRLGLHPDIIIARLGCAPLGLPLLKLFTPPADTASVLTDTEPQAPILRAPRADTFINDNTSLIRNLFLNNPSRWYAMSLRPHVRYPELLLRLDVLKAILPPVELFYPVEEIARAIGKKIVYKERPFIRSVVFFRARLTDISRIFARIGDIAWCYRRSGRPGEPYAAIDPVQFALFQQTISRFTPDYEVAPIGELPFRKNDRVVILGGPFTGMQATFHSASKAEEGVVYRLNIVGDNGIEWRINIDSRLTKPDTRIRPL